MPELVIVRSGRPGDAMMREPKARCRAGRIAFVEDGEGWSSGPPDAKEDIVTHFLMTVHGPGQIDENGNYGSKRDMENAMAATEEFNERLRADGHWVFAGGLQSVSTAAVVDGRGERPIVTDGPYLESKEYLAGFWIIDAANVEVARALALEGSRCCGAVVEVRPFDERS